MMSNYNRLQELFFTNNMSSEQHASRFLWRLFSDPLPYSSALSMLATCLLQPFPWASACFLLSCTESPCADAADLSNYEVSLSQSLCKAGSPEATFQGAPCGANSALVQWNLLAAKGCPAVDRAAADPKQQADW